MKTVHSGGLRAALLGTLALSSCLVLNAQTPPAAPPPVPAAPAAPAAPATPPAKPWYEEIAVNGFVSASYSYNLNRPDSGTN